MSSASPEGMIGMTMTSASRIASSISSAEGLPRMSTMRCLASRAIAGSASTSSSPATLNGSRPRFAHRSAFRLGSVSTSKTSSPPSETPAK